jgi:hypothetical protein
MKTTIYFKGKREKRKLFKLVIGLGSSKRKRNKVSPQGWTGASRPGFMP